MSARIDSDCSFLMSMILQNIHLSILWCTEGYVRYLFQGALRSTCEYGLSGYRDKGIRACKGLQAAVQEGAFKCS